MTLFRPLILTLCALVLALTAAPGAADEDAQAADPDWPCDQILVPRIAAATLWDGPPVDGLAWRETAPVADLVGRLTQPGLSEEAAGSAVAAFAQGLAPADKAPLLTLVFAGVLEVLDQERAHQLDGIRRYSQDQARRAEALGLELDQMVVLERDPSEAAAKERAALKERLTLEERVFDEREKSIGFLCTRPVVLEQRLGFLARTIAGFMD